MIQRIKATLFVTVAVAGGTMFASSCVDVRQIASTVLGQQVTLYATSLCPCVPNYSGATNCVP